jgi:hypothetical protein
MNDIQKRFILFLGGCIPVRILFVYLATIVPLSYLQMMGYIASILAIGFMYLFLSGTRKTGTETFGQPIWWNLLRPIHGLFYALFSYYAIHKNRDGWIYLLYDVILGLVSFIVFHAYNSIK